MANANAPCLANALRAGVHNEREKVRERERESEAERQIIREREREQKADRQIYIYVFSLLRAMRASLQASRRPPLRKG